MAAAVSAPALSDIIGAIYDCAIDPARWPRTLERVCAELGFVNAVFALQPVPAGRTLLSAAYGIDPPFLDTLGDYSAEVLDQWGGPYLAPRRPVGEPIVLSRVNPDACMPDRDDRYYREWRRPQGLIDTLQIILLREVDAVGTISFGRHESAGLIGAHEIELATLLSPHLQRAATISRLLDTKSMAAATFEAVLDTLSLPVLLVGPSLEILHANWAAQAMLADGRLIRAKDNALATASVGVTTALAVAVAQALKDESAIGRKGFGVPASLGKGKVQAFHVLPLRFGAVRPGISPGAVAAIFISPAPQPSPVLGDLLARLFDLTPAEMRVFEHIAAGRTVAGAARALGVSPSTVKTHLLHLFEKVGVRRQADLVALAASFAAPVRSGRDGLS